MYCSFFSGEGYFFKALSLAVFSVALGFWSLKWPYLAKKLEG